LPIIFIENNWKEFDLPHSSFARLPRLSLYSFGFPHLNRRQLPVKIRGNRTYPTRCGDPSALLLPVIGVPLGPCRPIFSENNSAPPHSLIACLRHRRRFSFNTGPPRRFGTVL